MLPSGLNRGRGFILLHRLGRSRFRCGCILRSADGRIPGSLRAKAHGERQGRKSRKCNTGGKDLRRRKPIEAFSGTAIDEMLNALNISI